MNKKLLKITLACFLSIPAQIFSASPGELDVTFNALGNQPGTEVLPISGGGFKDRSTIVQPDHKILMVVNLANLSPYGSTSLGMGVVRLNSNGNFDTTFGVGGVGTAPFSESINTSAACLALQEDSKIVVAGSAIINGQECIAVAQLNSDGSLDASFNLTGTQTIVIGTESQAFALAVQSDGKIIIDGYAIIDGLSYFTVVRLNIDGSFDTSFGTGGIITLAIGSEARAYTAAIQNDGKIILAGYSVISGVAYFTFVRLESDGSFDTTFGTGGIQKITMGSGSEILSIMIQVDGKIIAVGVFGEQAIVMRLETTGMLDTVFNGTGYQVIPVFFAASVALQSDTKIVIGGYGIVNETIGFGVARLTSNGAFDTTFNGTGINMVKIVGTVFDLGASIAVQSDGKIVVSGGARVSNVGNPLAIIRVLSEETPSFDEAYSVALKSDGKMVVAGYNYNGTIGKFAVARVQENGDLDTTFNLTGTQTVEIGTESGARAVAIQSTGEIVMAGYAVVDSVYQFAVVKLKADGSLDTTFNSTGVATITLGTEAVARAIAIQDDGKIVVVGYAVIDNVPVFAVMRLLGNGVLDTTFGTDGIVTISMGSSALSRALALQSDNKIVAVGYAYEGTGQFAIARLLGDQTVPKMTLTSWLKTVYAQHLGYVPGDDTVTIS